MIKTNIRAFTLIELMITLCIAAILLGVGLPSFNYFIKQNKMAAQVNQLSGALRSARAHAITENKKITICPTINGSACTSDWNQGYMLFVDDNQDRLFDADEKLLNAYLSDDKKISLEFRAFGRRSSLQWHETGRTNHQNGKFRLCYPDEPKLAREVIISKSGRIRISKDTNGDGIHEGSDGKNIQC